MHAQMGRQTTDKLCHEKLTSIKSCVFFISGGMSELQATLEFSVELNKFYNVDLFQRG